MSFEQKVEEHHVLDYQSTVELALQTMGPKLRQYVDEVPCQGEQSSYITIFDETAYSRRSGRKPENLDNRTNRRRRWLIYQDPIEDGEYIDSVDLWRQAFDPSSSLMQSKAQSVGRGIDDIILEGITGAAYEGKRGETTVNLPSAQKVGIQVGSGETPADVGMNVSKLRAAKVALGKAEVDLDRESAYVALSEDEHDALFEFVEATSADYQSWDASQRPAFRDGKLTRFMGLSIVRYQRLLTNGAGTIRYCPVWVKSGIKLGVWSDIRSRMWNDSHRNQTPVINIDFVGDCRRTQDGKVVEIACKIPS